MLSLRYSLLLLALCASAIAFAEPIYKCVRPDGTIAFQDQPCPPGASQSKVRVAPPPPADAEPEPAAPPHPATPPPPKQEKLPPAPKPLPPLWVCHRAEDGKNYFSENGRPPVKYVPLGVMGYPGRSLAQAYGPGGIGVSAPGMRQIPIDRSPADALASGYTPMQDTCVRASRDQTCNYLRKQLDEVQEKLRNAFKDQQAILQPKADKLYSELDGC